MFERLSRRSEELARGRPYSERSDEAAPWYDRFAMFLYRWLWLPVRARLRQARGHAGIVDEVAAHAAQLASASDADLQVRVVALRQQLRRPSPAAGVVAESFALISEAAWRTIGKRHYPCQFMAGWSLLQGRLVEMATGEGKTFAAVLPAVVAAWSGRPVHVITVNDYLAKRDAEELRPLYGYLGLSVGVVVQDMRQAEQRRAAYAQAITYCSNKELGFDYLRDRVATGRRTSRLHMALERLQGTGRAVERELVLRGMVFGIVDEADSVFIDEARTPLILAADAKSGQVQADLQRALTLARSLSQGYDFRVDEQDRRILLLEPAKAKLASMNADPGVWSSARAGAELLTQALSAIHLYRRDHHYVVSDQKVQIVDEPTGRAMPDRRWERGLHQMIEAKEGCVVTPQQETVSRITYQRLFGRYVALAGMTGTAAEVAREVMATHRLHMDRMPLNRPALRARWPDLVFQTEETKWTAVAAAAEQVARHDGRPVLIGTRSVQASEQAAALLTARQIPYELLNARQDQREAEIVAAAGQPGCVTVATNMAGRGTDIKLGPGVAELGGLHVILTEYHESRRIDRQLFGRCARQGDPGTCQAMVSLEDELYRVHAPTAARVARLVARLWPDRMPILARWLTWIAQAAAERRNAYARNQTLKSDKKLDKALAFSGRGE